MKSRKFLIPFVLFLLATPPLLVVALFSAGAGHGDYFWVKILFPLTMLSAGLFRTNTNPVVALAVVQFPLYGAILGLANGRRRLKSVAIALAVLHLLALTACFFL